MKALLGLVRPTEGSCSIFGRSSLAPDSKEEVGFLPENPYFYKFLTGAETVSFYGRLCGLSGKSLKEKVRELLELVGLDPKRTLESYPHELSGGQRQRVLIAMALTRDPKVVIADEPTTALDVTVQKQVIDLLNKLQKELGFAMVFVSHDLALVAEVANSITVMYAGQVVEQGPVKDILCSPVHEYTRGLLGSVLSIEAACIRFRVAFPARRTSRQAIASPRVRAIRTRSPRCARCSSASRTPIITMPSCLTASSSALASNRISRKGCCYERARSA